MGDLIPAADIAIFLDGARLTAGSVGWEVTIPSSSFHLQIFTLNYPIMEWDLNPANLSGTAALPPNLYRVSGSAPSGTTVVEVVASRLRGTAWNDATPYNIAKRTLESDAGRIPSYYTPATPSDQASRYIDLSLFWAPYRLGTNMINAAGHFDLTPRAAPFSLSNAGELYFFDYVRFQASPAGSRATTPFPRGYRMPRALPTSPPGGRALAIEQRLRPNATVWEDGREPPLGTSVWVPAQVRDVARSTRGPIRLNYHVFFRPNTNMSFDQPFNADMMHHFNAYLLQNRFTTRSLRGYCSAPCSRSTPPDGGGASPQRDRGLISLMDQDYLFTNQPEGDHRRWPRSKRFLYSCHASNKPVIFVYPVFASPPDATELSDLDNMHEFLTEIDTKLRRLWGLPDAADRQTGQFGRVAISAFSRGGLRAFPLMIDVSRQPTRGIAKYVKEFYDFDCNHVDGAYDALDTWWRAGTAGDNYRIIRTYRSLQSHDEVSRIMHRIREVTFPFHSPGAGTTATVQGSDPRRGWWMANATQLGGQWTALYGEPDHWWDLFAASPFHDPALTGGRSHQVCNTIHSGVDCFDHSWFSHEGLVALCMSHALDHSMFR